MKKYRIKYYYDQQHNQEIWMPQVRTCICFWTDMVCLRTGFFDDIFFGGEETKSEESAMDFLKEYHQLKTAKEKRIGIQSKIIEVKIEDLFF